MKNSSKKDMQRKLTTSASKAMQLPFANKETLRFCGSENLLPGVAAYYRLVLKVFKGAGTIKIRLYSDADTEKHYYVCFDVMVDADVNSVFEKLESFEKLRAAGKIVPKEPNIHFVLMPTIKHAKATFIMANNTQR